MNNIFVGNLSFEATQEDVQKLFEAFGTVANVKIMERKKGKSRGYAFVDMPNEEEKNAAIAALEGKEFMWRKLSVSVIVPKVPGEFRPKKKFKPAEKKWDDHRETKPWVKRESREERSTGNPRHEGRPIEKPWIKKEGGSKPWFKSKEQKPYNKFKSHAKSSAPWGKPKKDFAGPRSAGNPRHEGRPTEKPWIKKESSPRPAGPRPSGRPTGRPQPEGKVWEKKPSSFKPGKPGGAFKMFHKMSKRPKHVPKKGQART